MLFTFVEMLSCLLPLNHDYTATWARGYLNWVLDQISCSPAKELSSELFIQVAAEHFLCLFLVVSCVFYISDRFLHASPPHMTWLNHSIMRREEEANALRAEAKWSSHLCKKWQVASVTKCNWIHWIFTRDGYTLWVKVAFACRVCLGQLFKFFLF